MTEWELIYIQYNPLFSLFFIMKSSTLKQQIQLWEKNTSCLQNCWRNCEALGSFALRILVLF